MTSPEVVTRSVRKNILPLHGPQLAGSIFPFTNSFFLREPSISDPWPFSGHPQ